MTYFDNFYPSRVYQLKKSKLEWKNWNWY